MELKPIFPLNREINQTNYYWFENGFTSDEVDKIVKDSKNMFFKKHKLLEMILMNL
jgi:hypothetical protein